MGMGQTFDQAMATTKSLRSFAISIDMDVNQAMDDFNDLAPELIAHGSKMDKVFKGLMKISRKTGLSMQTLADVAGQFDTLCDWRWQNDVDATSNARIRSTI